MSSLTPGQLEALEELQHRPELHGFFFREATGLKWFDELERRGFFNPINNPSPVEVTGGFSTPGWAVLRYLENSAPELQTAANLDYGRRYLELIRAITNDSVERGFSNYQTWWQLSKMMKFIPIELLSAADIDQMRHWLSGGFDHDLAGAELSYEYLGTLLASRIPNAPDRASQLLEVVTELRTHAKGSGQPRPLLAVGNDAARKAFDAHAPEIGSVLETAGLNILFRRLGEALELTQRDSFSAIWRPAIEPHPQNSEGFEAEDLLISACRDALSSFVGKRAAEAHEYLDGLLQAPQEVFARIAIWAVGAFHTRLPDLALRVLRDPKFYSANSRHETYHLLRLVFPGARDEDRLALLAVIDRVAAARPDRTKSTESQQGQQAYEALRWLSAVRGIGHEPADSRYSENLAITGVEPEHPDFSSFSSSGFVTEQSPYTVDELLGCALDKLLDLLGSFRPSTGFSQPTRRGLALTLKEALKARPDRFDANLGVMSALDTEYIYHLLVGYRELWSESRHDNWAGVFEFATRILDRPQFWDLASESELDRMAADRNWVVGAIADLIKVGTIDDDSAFDPEHLPTARNLLAILLDRTELSQFEGGRSDAVSNAISSPRGRCIEALINYALRRCRLSDASDGNHESLWTNDLAPLFGRELELLEAGNSDFATHFGMYLPNLLYVNRDWTTRNFERVFDRRRRPMWLCAISGFTYVSNAYEEIYLLLRAGGHLLPALEADELDAGARRRIVDNITIAHLQGREPLQDDDSEMSKLLARAQSDELGHLIWFVWTLREKEDPPSFVGQILPLWSAISVRVEEEADREKVLSMLVLWTGYVTDLEGQAARLVTEAARYAARTDNYYSLIGELRRLVDQNPNGVADVYLAILAGSAPLHVDEDLKATLGILYAADQDVVPKANRIRDQLIAAGLDVHEIGA